MKRIFSTLSDNAKIGLLLGFIYLVFLSFALNPQIIGNDGIGYYSYLHSMVFDKDFDFTNEFAHYTGQYIIVGYSPVTHLPVNGVPMGSAILWLPFYLGAHLLLKFMSIFLTMPWAADGYSYPYVFSVCLASSLYGALGLWFTYLSCRLFYKVESTFSGVFLGWMATALVFYMYLHPSMAHANSFFLSSCFLYLLLKIRNSKSTPLWYWGLLGIIMGLLSIVRNQDVILWGLIAILVFPWQERKLTWQNGIVIGLGALIVIFPQVYAWKMIFGSWLSGPQSHQIGANTHIFSPHLFSVLFSGRHGLFTWHPVLLAGMIGWYLIGKKDKTLAWTLLIVFILQLWVTASWREWWGAHSFGHRMFVSFYPMLILGIAACWDYLTSRIFKLWLFLGSSALIIWNAGLIYQYAFNLLDRDGTTPFLQVILHQFTAVPASLLHHFLK